MSVAEFNLRKIMRLLFLFATAIVCINATKEPKFQDVSNLNIDETQALLKYLGLHVFAETFAKQKYNGLAISLMKPGDLTQKDVPDASAIHFK